MKQLIIILLFFPSISYCQPGGGGTINIHNIYDSSGTRINIENDSLLSVRCYLLNDTTFLTESIYSEIDYSISEARNTGGIQYYLDSMNSPNYKCLTFGRISPFANYRLCILSEEDTMIVDFVKVIGENPHGINIHIDSLTVQSQYVQFKKEDMHCINTPFDNCWAVSKTSNFLFNSLIYDKRKPIAKYEKNRYEEWRDLMNLK